MKTMVLNSRMKGVVSFTTDEDSRYTLHGVCLTEKNGFPVAQATDGHRCIEAVDMTDFGLDSMPDIPGFSRETAEDAPDQVIIPKDAWVKGLTTPTKKGKKGLPFMEMVVVNPGMDQTTFGSTDLDTCSVTPTRNLSGSFPNLDMVIPRAPGDTCRIQVGIDATYLKELCATMAGFHTDRSRGIVIELQVPKDLTECDYYNPTRPVLFFLKNDSFYVRAAIMPMNLVGDGRWASCELPVKPAGEAPLTEDEVKALEITLPDEPAEVVELEAIEPGPEPIQEPEIEPAVENEEEIEEEPETVNLDDLDAVDLDPEPIASPSDVPDVVTRARAKLGLVTPAVPFVPPVAPPTNGAAKSFSLADLL